MNSSADGVSRNGRPRGFSDSNLSSIKSHDDTTTENNSFVAYDLLDIDFSLLFNDENGFHDATLGACSSLVTRTTDETTLTNTQTLSCSTSTSTNNSQHQNHLIEDENSLLVHTLDNSDEAGSITDEVVAANTQLLPGSESTFAYNPQQQNFNIENRLEASTPGLNADDEGDSAHGLP